MSQLKEKIVHGVFWQTLERCGSIGITFVISVILARLLTPRQFGLVALAAVLIDIATAIIDSGLPKALIQKQDVDETDCNSVFYLNITLGVLMYGIIFPLAWSAFFTANSSPPQQGTSMRSTVTLRISFLRKISVSFSL